LLREVDLDRDARPWDGGRPTASTLVDEEPDRHRARADDVERVDDVVEPTLYRRIQQLVFSQTALVERTTGVQELT
jgi:hypothetical protein